LGDPLGKIVHAVHLGCVDVFKVRLMTRGGFVGQDQGLGGPVIQGLVENPMRRWKTIHYEEGAPLSEDDTMRFTGISA
jgi:hypothetical protein